MFQSLLRAKQNFVTKTDTDKNFELFVKSFQEFEKNMEAIEEKTGTRKIIWQTLSVKLREGERRGFFISQ